jgi:Ca2+-binding RTX toxin-like protein
MKRLIIGALAGLSAMTLGWLLVGTAGAAQSIQNVTTSENYSTVTVTFSEPVVGTGTDDEIAVSDVQIVGGPVTVLQASVDDSATELTIKLSAAIDTPTTIMFVPENLSTMVPLAPSDWIAVRDSLLAMGLPAVSDVPIAADFLNLGEPTRAMSEFLPADMASSLDLPGGYTAVRNADGTFAVTIAAATALADVDVNVAVDVAAAADGTALAIDLASDTTTSLAVALSGDVSFDADGAITGGALQLDLAASDKLAMSGSIGPVGVTAASTNTLVAGVDFTAGAGADTGTTTLSTATIVIDQVTIAGLGAGGTDIVVGGSPLTLSWPTPPTYGLDRLPVETVVVTDNGWATAGLSSLANVSLNEVMGAPGGIASGLVAAEDLGNLVTAIPLVGGSIGDVIGVGHTLGTAQNEIATAFSISNGAFSAVDVPHLSPTVCADLASNRVRAAEVDAVLAADQTLREFEPTTQKQLETWQTDVLAGVASLPGAAVDEAAVTAAFAEVCGYLYGAIDLDLLAGTLELGVDIPGASLDILSATPALSMSFDGWDVDGLAVSLDSGTWTGTTSVSVDLTVGIKLASDADILATNGLVVDLDADPTAATPVPATVPDAGDVTAAHRIYVPIGAIATADVSLTGTGLSGNAQLGFLDLAVTGDVAITPTVSVSTIDPGTGAADGLLDLAEFIDATVVGLDGSSGVDTVVDFGFSGDDVDAHFNFTNSLVSTSAAVDVVGDLAAIFPGGNIEFRSTAIAGPGDVAADTLAIGQTFGDSLDIAALSPFDVVAMVADSLDALATNASTGAGDQRLPVIDVTLDEVAGFTTKLSDAADAIRDRAPTTVSELEAFVNDALEANGMGAVTVGFATAGPSGDPELTLTLDASVSASASFPVTFTLGDLSLAPVDAGARLDAAVAVRFEPVLGIRFSDADPFTDRVFVRDVAATFDVSVDGTVDGGIAFGPLEASIDGAVTIGDADLDTGGFTATLQRTSDGSGTVPLSAFTSGDVEVAVAGSLPVSGSLNLSVPLIDASGTVTVTGTVPGGFSITTDLDLPNLRTLLAEFEPNLGSLTTGAIETARFIARGSDEASELSGNIPVVGSDVGSGFDDISATMDMVADEIETAVAFLEDNDNDAAVYLEKQINDMLGTLGSAGVSWVGGSSISDASGIEILLTIEGSVSASPTASFGLEPLIDLDIDVSDATGTVGYRASIGLGVDVQQGFYLFPGIDTDPTDDVGTLLEIYASFDLDARIDLTLAGVSAGADAVVAVGGPLNDRTAAGLRVDMPDRLPFADVVNRSRSFSDTLTPALSADITASLPVEFPVRVGDLDVEFLFPIDFAWSFDDTLSPSFSTAQLAVVDATLDIASFADPIASLLVTFDEKYNPVSIAPIKEVLNTEIPLIETTVGDALLTICEVAAPTDPTCIAFNVLTDIPGLAQELSSYADNGGVPLGSFQILPAPPNGVSRYALPGTSLPIPPAAPTAFAASVAAPASGSTAGLAAKVTQLTGGYMSVPILSDYEAIMGIVLGGELGDDVEFIRFEIPEEAPLVLGYGINFKKTLFDLDIGFINGNLKVELHGGIGLRISGGFGYSSRGIQTGNPLDGLFLIDNGASEVSLGASVSAAVDGRFSLEAGFEIGSVRFKGSGSISADAGLDLFDESPVLVGRGGGDGRLFIDEIAIIADAYYPPVEGVPSALCMFQLRTTGKWSLSFSGKAKVLGITVFDKSFSDGDTLWDETYSCKLRTRIARVEDRQLILHAGPYADDRLDGEGDVSEEFDITTDGTTVTVKWVGHGDKDSLTFPVSSFDTIIADLGLEDDVVDVDEEITQPVMGRGGPGHDQLNGGGGDDDLDGGGGGDLVSGHGGNDVVRGGRDDDRVDGGDGRDDLRGGPGDDTYVLSDDFGDDTIEETGPAGLLGDTIDLQTVTTALTGDSAYGEATISTSGGTVTYRSAAIEHIIGGTAADTFTFKDQEPDGFSFDGSGDSDSSTFLSGRRDRGVSVHDSGLSGTDDVTIVGTASADNFLLRASSKLPGITASSDGFVAKLNGALVDRYDYDDSIEDIVVDGGLSADTFSLDDNAARTRIVGGKGNDIVQVGQIYGLADCEPNSTAEGACLMPAEPNSIRGTAVGVNSGDTFATHVITRGHLSNGVTHGLVIDGGDDNDTITVFANNAVVVANGGNGRDQFVARAFILTHTVTLNGDGDIDDFSYVANDDLEIDGGDGVDTFTVIGTEGDDGFIIDIDPDGLPTVSVCPIDSATDRPNPDPDYCAINAHVDAVEVFAVIGLEGDDVFWIRSTVSGSLVELSGGANSDRFLIGDGTLDRINGPVIASGDDVGEVPAIPDPVVLPGEDDTEAFTPAVTGGTNRGDMLEIDASTDPDNLVGEITESNVRGLGMATGPFNIGTGLDSLTATEVLQFKDLEFASVTTGLGVDEVTVTSTHVGNGVCDGVGCPLDLLTGDGKDIVDVRSISGQTVVDLGDDADRVTVGQPKDRGDSLDAIDAGLTVLGGTGEDMIDLDDVADAATRVDIAPGLITQAGLSAAGVTHSAVETVNVHLGDGSDTANVRGTAADATSGTHVYGNGGNEHFYVSSAAEYSTTTSSEDYLVGHLDDIGGPLFVHGQSGDYNQLMISDRDAAAGDPGVAYNGAVLTGLAPAPINHDVIGGAFGRGITIWTSEFAEEMSVTGTDRSAQAGTRTLTTLNTGDGRDVIRVDLADSDDGAFVLNVEEGNDNVDARESSLDLVVYGGLGSDVLTTGSGNDIVIGDLATVTTTDGLTITGQGGPGDRTDGGIAPINRITSDPSDGDADTIETGAGTDTAFGGTGDDDISGGPDDDVLIGGHSVAGAPDGIDTINGDGGEDLIAGDNAKLDLSGAIGVFTLFDVETTSKSAPAGSGAGDKLSGGAGNDAIYGQQGNDKLLGEGGDDIIEGNSGDDTIFGGSGQDDILGGGSALDGVLDGTRAWVAGTVALADGNDTIDGEGGDDLLLGDNGWILRTVEADGSPTTLADVFGQQNSVYDDMVVRDIRSTTTIEPDGSFGADLIRGGGGSDEIHGQLDTTRVTIGGNSIAGDELLGGPGDDVIIGDLGSVVDVLEDGGNQASITDSSPFLDAELRAAGSLTREVTLFLQQDGDHVDTGDESDAAQFGAEGDDFMLGGEGSDSIHGGAGDDVANGGAGADFIFGGDGNDAIWGGADDDELFGGHDEDSIDVVPRDFTTTTRGRDSVTLGPDPDIWFEAAASADALSGLDIAYGGWNSDEMQADERANGPKPGDRLIDWAGAYNRYLGCSNGRGAGTFLRAVSPSIMAFVTDLAEGRGAVEASIAGTSGYRELGIVEIADIANNAGSVGGTDHVACP